MKAERWREILSVLPGEAEIALRSERARQRAMEASFVPAQSRPWRLVTAAGLTMAMAALWIAYRPMETAPKPQIAEEERIEMRMQLSDGTRVNWVIDNGYAL